MQAFLYVSLWSNLAWWRFLLARGDHVWWPLTTIRMLSDYWRTESNISMLPGKKDGWLLRFLCCFCYCCVPVMERSFPSPNKILSFSVLMGAQPQCLSWTLHPSTMSWRGAKHWAVGRRRRGMAWRTKDLAFSVLRCVSNNWGSYAVACSCRTKSNGLNRISGSALCTVCRGCGIPLCCRPVAKLYIR